MGSLLAAGLSEDPRPWDSVPGSPGGRGPEDRSLQNLGEELVLWETGRGLAPREVAVGRWGGVPEGSCGPIDAAICSDCRRDQLGDP